MTAPTVPNPASSVTVTLTNPATGQRYTLTDAERDEFFRELSRTAPWRTLRGLIAYLLGRDRYTPTRIAADVAITVTQPSGARREYAIHGRSVLHEVASRRNRQFYMGLLLTEWVN